MTFALPEGGTLRRVFAPTHTGDPRDDAAQPWRSPIFRLEGEEDGADGWQHVHDYLPERPAYLRSRESVWYEHLADIDASYVRLASIRNPNGPGTLHSALFGIIDRIEADEPKDLIVDLRFNTGGNFFNAVPFAFGAGVVIPPDGRIYLLANRCTFSAAIVAMSLVKANAGDERVVIVGEPIGDRLRFWAEGGNVILPASQILVSYRDGLHDMVDGCTPDEDCWWGAAAFERGVGELDPDLPVRETFEDFVSGRDLYLEAVRAHLGEED